MKDINKVITESVNSGRKNYIREAVNQLLGEDITSGQTVAIIDDVIGGATGAKGKVKSLSDANSGFATVTLEGGTEVIVQSSLLVPV